MRRRVPALLCVSAVPMLAACGASTVPTVVRTPVEASTPTLGPVPALAARVDRVRAVFRERGASPFAESPVVFLRPGEARGVSWSVDRARCVGVTAVGLDDVGPLELRVLSGDGAEVARDAQPSGHPYVRVCAPGAGRYFSQVSAGPGGGEVAVLAMADGPIVAPPVAEALHDRPRGVSNGGRTSHAVTGRDPAVLPPAEAIERVLTGYEGRGFRRIGGVVSGNMPRGRSEQHPWALDGGRCYLAVALGGERVEDLDLVIHGPRGNTVAQDVAVDARPRVAFCAPETGAHAVEVRLFAGSGEWSVAVLEMPRSQTAIEGAEIPEELRAPVALVDADAHETGWSVSMAPWRGAAWLGAELRRPVLLRAGSCYRFAAVTEASLPIIDLWLARADGAVLSTFAGARPPSEVYACATANTRAVLHARAGGGRGSFVVWGYRQESGR